MVLNTNNGITEHQLSSVEPLSYQIIASVLKIQNLAEREWFVW